MKFSLLIIAMVLVAASTQSHVSKNHEQKSFGEHAKLGRRLHPGKSLARSDGTQDKATQARKLVHDSGWASVGTHSTLKGFESYPFDNVQLIADAGTGTPYWYIAKVDETYKDITKNPKAALLFSQDNVDDSCKNLKLGAKDPACPRALLLGDMVSVVNDAKECDTAWQALKAKYPALDDYDMDDYYIGKLDIKAVFVRGPTGAVEQIPLADYQKANP